METIDSQGVFGSDDDTVTLYRLLPRYGSSKVARDNG
jgi:hypothetical protein